MKHKMLELALLTLFSFWVGALADQWYAKKYAATDAHVAAGEWKIEMQVPPCTVKNGKPNIEVNFKPNREDPAVIAVGCNEMPVPEK